MIISENQIKVPGKRYKVKVKSVSTRRLTAIEWLILTSTKKFRQNSSMFEKTLKYAFEEVFQLQNSELLIKPCLRHLRALEVINIAGGDSFNYETLRFTDIDLTELGDIMLKDGLLPGEPREIPLDIYYNPLTGKISDYNNSLTRAKASIDFGTESDYGQDFPKQHVIDELQKGFVGGDRFIASKFRIEEIENTFSTDWESVITMTVDVNEKNEIKTSPEIIARNIGNLLPKLFVTKEITTQFTEKLPERSSLVVDQVIGSDGRIKEAILDVCKNGKFLFMDFQIYQLYKRNTASFKNTVIVLFDSENGFSIDNENAMLIHIPDKFQISGCVVVNEKGEHISLCKNKYTYGDEKIIAPLAIEDNRLNEKNRIAIKWFENIITAHYQEDIKYIGLITLPLFAGCAGEWKDILYSRWIGMELETIVQELNKIHATCLQLKTEMFDISFFLDVILEKVDSTEYETVLKNIKIVMDSHCIRRNSSAHRCLVENIVSSVKKPDTYVELYRMLDSLGITTHDEALVFDDVIGRLYNEDIIKSILAGIVCGSYKKLPELFEMDVFFNEYVDELDQIEKHVSDLHLFEKMDEELLDISVELCPNIADLQSYMAEIHSKNAYLMTRGINVYDVLRKVDAEKTNSFFVNMQSIERFIEQRLQGEYVLEEKTHLTEDKSEKKRKMYVLDTCALMHNPEILLYFADDEYVRIPTKVIDELGKIKDKRNRKYDASSSDTARRIARDIDMYYLQLFNRRNRVRFLIENAELELLPKDLDATVPDNQILSLALKYKDWETYIVSDDGVFRLTAQAQNIQAITGAKFIEMHQDSKKTLNDWIRAENLQSVGTILSSDEHKTIKEVSVEITKTGKKTPLSAATPDGNDLTSKDTSVEERVVDSRPIRELIKYFPDFNESVINYLSSCGIKTIGSFCMLTEGKVRDLPAKGKQMIYKNNVMRAVKQMNIIIPKIKTK
ncbi:MAG: PIN domain-containing protein [Clostridiaceae bacterium]|nr:PIN domain-containing protein [Clostridiaceae bacterium]